jgi:hypothetical protein
MTGEEREGTGRLPPRSEEWAWWRLTVHGADLPGKFIIVDGRFVEVEPGLG